MLRGPEGTPALTLRPAPLSALQSEDWSSLPFKISLSPAWAQRDTSTAEQRRGKSAFQVRTALQWGGGVGVGWVQG